MKTSITVLALIALAATSRASDFTFSYNNVLEAQAGDFIVSTQNISAKNDGSVSYWSPITAGSEAILTQKFTFSNPTTGIQLFTKLASYNFGSGNFGSGSVWASTDGTDWQLLLDAPAPVGLDAYYSFNDSLPPSLVGSTELYLQTRLETSGWNIMAQWSRDTATITEPVFSVNADVVPEPSSNVLMLLGAVFAFGIAVFPRIIKKTAITK